MSAKIEPTQADREAYIEWSGGMPERDRQTILAGEWDATTGMQVLARHAQAARAEGYEQAIRDVVVMAKQRKDEWSFAISNGLQRISVSKSYADGAADEADALTAAILKLLENRE